MHDLSKLTYLFYFPKSGRSEDVKNYDSTKKETLELYISAPYPLPSTLFFCLLEYSIKN